MANSAVVGLLRALLVADTAQFDKALKRSEDHAKLWSRELKRTGQQAVTFGATLTKAITLPLAGIATASVKLAMDFQSSLAGVSKTTGVVGEDLVVLGKQFRDLSKTIPANVNEITRLGEAAGALGIPKEKIVDFTRVMSMLGVTTNLSAEQAANATAKIQNIFQSSGKETENFASSLVKLGNEGASTETEIIELANRIASAGRNAGMSQADVLGFSAALANVGIEAEAGGTAMSRIFDDIGTAVSLGGKELENFARISNKSVEDFRKDFKTDAADAVKDFIEGLGRMQKQGGDLNIILRELGFTEVRQSRALRDLALSGKNLADSLNYSNTAWKENTALSKEAQTRYGTLESQLTLLWNRIKDVGITIGNALLPFVTKLVEWLGKLIPVAEKVANFFGNLPVPIQAVAIGLAGISAVAGPMIWVMGQMALAASAIAAAFTAQGIATRILTAANLDFLRTGAGVLSFLGRLGIVAGVATVAVTAGAGAANLHNENLERQKKLGADVVKGLENIAKKEEEVARLRKNGNDMQAYKAEAELAAMKAGQASLHQTEKKIEKGKEEITVEQLRMANLIERAELDAKAADEAAKKANAEMEAAKKKAAADEAAEKAAKKRAKAQKEATQEAIDQLAILQSMSKHWNDAVMSMFREPLSFEAKGGVSEDLSKMMAKQIHGMADFRSLIGELPVKQIRPDEFIAMVGMATDSHGVKVTDPRNLAQKMFGGTFTNIASALPAVIQKSFQGGGDVAKSIGGLIGGASVEGVGQQIAKSMMGSKIGGAIGGVIGSVVPVVGTLIGGFLGNKLGGLFGASKNQKAGREADVEIKKLQDAMVGPSGIYKSMGELESAAKKVGMTFSDIWDRRGVDGLALMKQRMEEFNAKQEKAAELQSRIGQGIDRLSGSLQVFGGVVPSSLRPLIEGMLTSSNLTKDMRDRLESLTKDPSWQDLQSRAEALGIKLSDLGPKFSQSRLGDIALGYVRDLKAFEEQGASMVGVLVGMADELSTLRNEAKATGSTLPDSLKPYMQRLVDLGLLLDENGEKVETLNDVAFAEIEDKALTAVVDILKEIRDLLEKGLPDAAKAGAEGMQDAFNKNPIVIHPKFDYSGAGGGQFEAEDGFHQPHIGLSGGTHGRFVDWGAGTPVVLHGQERVMTKDEMGGGGVTIAIDARGAFFQDRRSMDYLADAVSRRMPTALRTNGL